MSVPQPVNEKEYGHFLFSNFEVIEVPPELNITNVFLIDKTYIYFFYLNSDLAICCQ
jgi:hypothetical protein